MINISLSLAFFMGIAAVFSPCGVAMLPVTLTWVGGTVKTAPHFTKRLWNGLIAALFMAVGFTLVVALLALVVHALGILLTPIIYPVMVVFSSILILSGILVISGRFHFPLDRWVSLDRFPRKMNQWTFFVAGVVYGITALSCTLPIFLAAFIPALTGSSGAFLELLAAFGSGIAVIFIILSEVILLFRDAALRFFRQVGPWLNPTLGIVVTGSGMYLMYYWVLGAGRFLL